MACATAGAAVHRPGTIAWFDGTVEAGLARAKAEKKPVFLYWGAVWCPPCNEIKSVVLESPEAARLLKSVVPIYLDGDTERAQLWADKLHVSSYPSLLLLDSTGNELLRIDESVELGEFTAALRSALAANRSQTDAVARALAGQATEDDWTMLADGAWDAPTSADGATRLKLFEACPPSFETQRALLAAKILESAAATPPADLIATAIRSNAEALIDAMFASDAAIFAARSTIASSSREIFTWLFPSLSDIRRAPVAERWTKAARWLATNESASASIRMLAAAPEVELWLAQNPGGVLPNAMLRRVREAVATADAAARTPEQRHAIISDAAELLAEAEDIGGARALLQKELLTTDTPWYYQSSLARIEQKAGHDAEALEWSAKARESVVGNASRLQWLVADLLLNAKIQSPDQGRRVADLLSAYYDLAFRLPDGFSGRNAVRARSVARKESEWAWPEVKAVLAEAKERCQKLRRTEPGNDCHVAFGVD
jgi:protein disulfide-isomerase